jgi:protein-L-isoaspartate(D-aspartate) O-methyltransferase
MEKSNNQQMLNEQIIARGVRDRSVIEAMSKVPRREFVPEKSKQRAYADSPLPIGYGQTISQPYIVAFMTEAAMLDKNSKVLEIGTGSGYQSAILAKLSKDVFTIEVIEPLGEQVKEVFKKLKYNNIHVRIGNGYEGWPEESPFDAIIVTAAPKDIPTKLTKQLKLGGRMIIPVGEYSQELLRITRTKEGLKSEKLMPVRFVPMVTN